MENTDFVEPCSVNKIVLAHELRHLWQTNHSGKEVKFGPEADFQKEIQMHTLLERLGNGVGECIAVLSEE